MTRCIVNVATGPYARGQARLAASLPDFGRIHNGKSWITHDDPSEKREQILMTWCDKLPPGSPTHERVPYGFKAFALNAADQADCKLILWVDASIVPYQSLTDLWGKIERDGYWISNNGWTNAEWTAESAYRDLGITREENERIPHVVATAFGLNLAHDKGRAFLDEYYRLAETRAFCGPWWNSNFPEYQGRAGAAPCGDERVRGHRHDQTAASVIAWKLGMELTNPPAWFAYRGGETTDTVLVADGKY